MGIGRMEYVKIPRGWRSICYDTAAMVIVSIQYLLKCVSGSIHLYLPVAMRLFAYTY